MTRLVHHMVGAGIRYGLQSMCEGATAQRSDRGEACLRPVLEPDGDRPVQLDDRTVLGDCPCGHVS